jgi:hypothetical protein
VHAGAADYDNWWTVGVALLYYAAHGAKPGERDATFDRSIRHYDGACARARQSPEVVAEDLADLLADHAEALYFRGDPGDIDNALALLADAEKLSTASHPEWHDWNRAWACYERGRELELANKAGDAEVAYRSAIDLLKSVPNLPNQYRRTLAVCYAALGCNDDARREGRKFLRQERSRGRSYDPAIEMRWPYKDRDKHKKLRERLRNAGLHAPE